VFLAVDQLRGDEAGVVVRRGQGDGRAFRRERLRVIHGAVALSGQRPQFAVGICRGVFAVELV
jgi:hypothetical protein